MSQTVAYTLVDVLEKIGVTHIFGLIADSLNPIGDAVRHSKIEWIGVRHEEGAALAAAGQAKLTGRLGVCCGSTGPGSTHLVAGSMRHVATTRRFLRSPDKCHVSCRASTIFRRQIPTCCSVMSRSIPKLFHHRHRPQPSFIKPSPPPMPAAAWRI